MNAEYFEEKQFTDPFSCVDTESIIHSTDIKYEDLSGLAEVKVECVEAVPLFNSLKLESFIDETTIEQVTTSVVKTETVEFVDSCQIRIRDMKSENDPLVYSCTQTEDLNYVNPRNIKRFECEVCFKWFSRKYRLREHQTVHTHEKPNKCVQCKKRFARRTQLLRHIKVHTGEKPFTCNVCFKKFSFSDGLKKHNRIHTGEKPYKCSICLKGFSQKQHLDMHVTSHTDARPHVCKLCGKCYRKGSTLVMHMRSHTGEKPYACELCEKKFANKKSLNAHGRWHIRETV